MAHAHWGGNGGKSGEHLSAYDGRRLPTTQVEGLSSQRLIEADKVPNE